MDLEIIRANPAGNITIFVLNPPLDKAGRAAAVQALMTDPALGAEQVGFVLPPEARRPASAYWRLEMMGGEFCGNAARSFGLLIASRSASSGLHSVTVEISGMKAPLPVRVELQNRGLAAGAYKGGVSPPAGVNGTAEVDLPGPLAETAVEAGGQRFPAYIFEGITHVIAENAEAGEGLLSLLSNALEGIPALRGSPPDALGVMFYDSSRCFMRPLVGVRSSGTRVFESSCGSGSAALGAWLARNVRDTEADFEIAQPGGTVTVKVVKKNNVIRNISIGGPVSLRGPERWPTDFTGSFYPNLPEI